jgi:MoxR-like ATPase
MTDTLRYRGDGMPPEGSEKREPYPYLADEGLVKAVNVAIHLNRPLLVKGPPGSGKTAVAYALAHELGVPLFPWYVKSTSRARDGLYTIDMVRRLQDSHLDTTRAQRLTPYIRFGPLGDALRRRGPSVVLIDEVDKADIDFPNDLLRELDERRFTIEELEGTTLTAREKKDGWRATYGRPPKGQETPDDPRPIVIITSNDEKELPDAFLRRCVFHYIEFPDPDRLLDIVRVNTEPEGLRVDEGLIKAAIGWLTELRRTEGLRKKPETSELIDWVRVLHGWGIDVAALQQAASAAELPHLEVLYKHQGDLVRVRGAADAAA